MVLREGLSISDTIRALREIIIGKAIAGLGQNRMIQEISIGLESNSLFLMFLSTKACMLAVQKHPTLWAHLETAVESSDVTVIATMCAAGLFKERSDLVREILKRRVRDSDGALSLARALKQNNEFLTIGRSDLRFLIKKDTEGVCRLAGRLVLDNDGTRMFTHELMTTRQGVGTPKAIASVLVNAVESKRMTLREVMEILPIDNVRDRTQHVQTVQAVLLDILAKIDAKTLRRNHECLIALMLKIGTVLPTASAFTCAGNHVY